MTYFRSLVWLQDKAPLAACYICCLTSTPGKFLPQKAKELGVKPGPLFGQLKAGTAVMGKDRMVQPEEVNFCLLLAVWCAALLSAMCGNLMLALNVSGLIVLACLCLVYDPYGIPALTPETWAASFDSYLIVI